MSANPHTITKVAKLRKLVLGAQLESAKYISDVVKGTHADAEGDKPTNRLRASLAMVQGAMAAQRAETQGPQQVQLGVILLERRLADTPENRLDWQREARELQDARSIDTTALPALPAKGG